MKFARPIQYRVTGTVHGNFFRRMSTMRHLWFKKIKIAIFDIINDRIMSTMKRAVEIKSASSRRAIVSNTVKSHANDPVVVKKAEEAKAFFKKAGFPKGK